MTENTQNMQAQGSGDERLAELFTRMEPRRPILLGVLELCREGKPTQQVTAHVSEAQSTNRSVFSAGAILGLLEEAGGIERRCADGSPWPEEPLEPEHVVMDADGSPWPEEPLEPEHVVVDGVEYLRAAQAAPAFWKTTDAGLRVLENDNPLERVEALFSDDATYLPVYKKALLVCSQDGGAAAGQLGRAIDKLDLVQEPRLFAAHFVERLERAGALEWRDAWTLTDIGVEALDMLSDVEAA